MLFQFIHFIPRPPLAVMAVRSGGIACKNSVFPYTHIPLGKERQMKVDTLDVVCDDRRTIHPDSVGELHCWTKAFVQT